MKRSALTERRRGRKNQKLGPASSCMPSVTSPAPCLVIRWATRTRKCEEERQQTQKKSEQTQLGLMHAQKQRNSGTISAKRKKGNVRTSQSDHSHTQTSDTKKRGKEGGKQKCDLHTRSGAPRSQPRATTTTPFVCWRLIHSHVGMGTTNKPPAPSFIMHLFVCLLSALFIRSLTHSSMHAFTQPFVFT